MTYRERREAKANRLMEWAEKRDAKAEALIDANKPYEGDIAFFTQPGRFTARDRYRARIDQAYQHTKKADDMASRAESILGQADRAIYSDDTDAVERLHERIAELEAQREHMKAVNATVRAAAKKGDAACAAALAGLDVADRTELLTLARITPYHDPLHKGYPSYALTNLGGNIRRYKERLDALTAPKPANPIARLILLRYAGTCDVCDKALPAGGAARYYQQPYKHVECADDCGVWDPSQS